MEKVTSQPQSLQSTAMKLEYDIEDRPPLRRLLLLGIQWFAIGVPSLIVIGKIVAGLHYTNPLDMVVYLQKLTFITGGALLTQILFGHRLPLILGPSTVLTIGVIAGKDFGEHVIYSAILLGGILLFLCSITGLFGKLQKLFTPRIVAVVLLLIAFTLLPSVLNLINGHGTEIPASHNIAFGLAFAFSLFLFQRFLKGIWQLTLLLWGVLGGSLIYLLLFSHMLQVGPTVHYDAFSLFFRDITIPLAFNPGIVISFIFSFIALSINDLGSIYSMKGIVEVKDMEKRVNHGITVTGLANVLSGFLGVIGPVNYSMSPGVILFTRCASRFTLLPSAALFIIFSFSPFIIGLLGSVPSVIIGGVLIFVLCSQVSAGLIVAFGGKKDFSYDDGLIIAMPLLFGCLVAFMPPVILNTFPLVVRPVVGNGFVVGVLTALILEHIIFKGKA